MGASPFFSFADRGGVLSSAVVNGRRPFWSRVKAAGLVQTGFLPCYLRGDSATHPEPPRDTAAASLPQQVIVANLQGQ